MAKRKDEAGIPSAMERVQAAKVAIRGTAEVELSKFGETLELRISQMEAAFAQELESIRDQVRVEMERELRAEIEAGKRAATDSQVRAAGEHAKLQALRLEIEQITQTWGMNAPIPLDPLMYASAAKDGSLAAWFARYQAWLRERNISVVGPGSGGTWP